MTSYVAVKIKYTEYEGALKSSRPNNEKMIL